MSCRSLLWLSVHGKRRRNPLCPAALLVLSSGCLGRGHVRARGKPDLAGRVRRGVPGRRCHGARVLVAARRGLFFHGEGKEHWFEKVIFLSLVRGSCCPHPCLFLGRGLPCLKPFQNQCPIHLTFAPAFPLYYDPHFFCNMWGCCGFHRHARRIPFGLVSSIENEALSAPPGLVFSTTAASQPRALLLLDGFAYVYINKIRTPRFPRVVTP